MIELTPATGSTNADLAERLAAGEYVREGDWLVADRQTAGRGRQGRGWVDAAGNFMGSTLVHRRSGDPDPASLALVAGLAVHGLVDAAVPGAAQLKWPNDVVAGGAKLAGILLERIDETVIVGIGVNLAAAPSLPDRPAIALAQLGPAPARDRFAQDLAAAFDLELERWRGSGLAPIVRRWLAAAHPAGTPLTAEGPGGAIAGTFAGLDEDGTLRLRLPDGSLRAIRTGEVRLSGPEVQG